MNLAFATTMIRPRYLPDSIVAQKVSAPEFLHSLSQERTFIGALEVQNQAIGWLRKGYSFLGGGTVVRFPRIWGLSGIRRKISSGIEVAANAFIY